MHAFLFLILCVTKLNFANASEQFSAATPDAKQIFGRLTGKILTSRHPLYLDLKKLEQENNVENLTDKFTISEGNLFELLMKKRVKHVSEKK